MSPLRREALWAAAVLCQLGGIFLLTALGHALDLAHLRAPERGEDVLLPAWLALLLLGPVLADQPAGERIGGLGDLSHASAVYSRDGRYAFVFGRDGGLTKIDMLEAKVVKRIIQSGNAIGGSISQDGRIVVAQNYTPGGIKAFDAATLELLSEVPAEYAPGKFSKVVGLADSSGNRFAYALFEGGEIWVSDFSNPKQPTTQRFPAGSRCWPR